MSVTPNYQVVLKQAIQTMLVSEMVTGRLQLVKAVARSRENQLNLFPYIGISVLKRSEAITATRQRQSTIDWAITCIVRSTVSLEDATDRLDLVLDDGNSGGVEPILRDPANYNLAGVCTKAEIKEVQFFDSSMMDPEQSPSQFDALAVIFYTTLQVLIQQ